jgi:hypothetical protein
MKLDNYNLNPFTIETIKDRGLVLRMLKFEDHIIHGPIGKQIYEDDSYEHFTSLSAMYAIHRIVLNEFNFSNTELDVTNYRKIFSHYYRSPDDFDKEIIDAVTYMRENKCIYYNGKDYNIGDHFEDVEVYGIDGQKVSLLEKIKPTNDYTLVGAFSNT